MESKHEIELAIRTAQAMKALSQLVGCSDPLVAKLTFRECIGQVDALGKFIMGLPEATRPAPRR
jgi:hypothetical protein